MTAIRDKYAVTDHGDGYKTVNSGFRGKHRLQHRVIMEQIIGRPLLPSEIVHHDDENRGNNDPSNLILCKDNKEHQLIHLRKRASKECGHADWRKCTFCKQWDAVENLTIVIQKRGKTVVEHRACGNEYRKDWAAKKRASIPRKKLGHDKQGRFVVIVENF
jgi:hypothetical protein